MARIGNWAIVEVATDYHRILTMVQGILANSPDLSGTLRIGLSEFDKQQFRFLAHRIPGHLSLDHLEILRTVVFV